MAKKKSGNKRIDNNPTGNQSIDDQRSALRNQFQLGEFDLMDKATNSQADHAFSQFIRANGGDPQALKNEIGAVRFGDRMREFFGKGDTTGQSGIINIGGGKTIQSLRDLADFNNPNAPYDGGARGGRGGRGGGGRGGGGQDDRYLGPALRGGGGFGGGGGAPGESGFLGFLEQQLMDRIGGGFGISEENQQAQQAALQSMFNRNLASSQHQLEAQLNAAGALGGGRHIVAGQEMAQGMQESFLNALAQQQMGFNQLALQDRQAAFGEGGNFANTRVNQQLGLGDINARNRATSAQFRLGQMDDRTRRDLGFAGLDLQGQQIGNQASQFNQSFGLQQQNQQFNQGLQTFLTNAGLLGLG